MGVRNGHLIFSSILPISATNSATMKKDTVMKTLQGLPEEFDSEELFRRLIFIDKLEKASKQADEGLGSSLEEVEAKFERKWAKEQ